MKVHANAAECESHSGIMTLPCCPKALVHDVVQFDLSCLDFLHKLGEGGFGTVRACKFRRADQRGDSPAVSSKTQSSTDEESSANGEEVKMPASKFARTKTTAASLKAKVKVQPTKKNSSSILDQALAYKRQASMAPSKDVGTIYAVKIISKKKVLESQQQEHLFNEIKYMSKMTNKLIC